MLIRSPDVPDNYFLLEPHKAIGDYARAYGDEIARRYEDYNVVYFPHFPLKCDLDFVRSLKMPPKANKIGAADGINESLYTRGPTSIGVKSDHVLFKLLGGNALAGYAHHQMLTVNAQISEALRILLPKYYSLDCANITWRLIETRDLGMHIDSFSYGRPFSEAVNRLHRVKLFINIDTEPRHWRTSFTLPEILARYRDHFPDVLPYDRNVIASAIDKAGLLRNAPSHHIHWPALSAVLVNAEAVAHDLVFGRRMIAVEAFCDHTDMLDPAKHTHTQLPRWIEGIGRKVGSPFTPLEMAARAPALGA